ncbi:MAG: M23 family metallopeptidase [Agarilytica sp.]
MTILFRTLTFVCLSLFSSALLSNESSVVKPDIIRGEWVQGALIEGRLPKGYSLEVLGRKVLLRADGSFVFGLGRDTSASLNVIVKNTAGVEKQFTYGVKQREYPTQRIEGVAKKYVAPPPEVSKRISEENRRVKQARKKVRPVIEFAEGFTWPLIGPITGVYGSQRVFNGVPKRPHYGLDIAGPVGAVVVAPAPGEVTLAHNDMYYSGGTLIVDHGYGVSSTFIHLSEILVSEGQKIARGQPIAKVGASGRVTGPHLDWRINWFSERLDPKLLLPPMPNPGGE